MVALSTVEKGEEVTIDYSTNVGWDGYSMECQCGAPGCRRIIRSYRYLDPQLRGRYGACVSRFLLGEVCQVGPGPVISRSACPPSGTTLPPRTTWTGAMRRPAFRTLP